MRYSAGQYLLPYAFQVPSCESSATGQVTPRRCTAAATLLRTFSKSNSGECTPTSTKPRPRYDSYRVRRWGRVRTQLTHEKVQKSTSTTLHRRPSMVRGEPLSQVSTSV